MHFIYGSLESPWSTLYSSYLNFFCNLLRLRRYEWKSVEVGIFRRGWVTLTANFKWKGTSPTNHCWYQKTWVIAVSFGVKMFAVNCLFLSQSIHVADRQNYDSQNPTSIAVSLGRNSSFPVSGLKYQNLSVCVCLSVSVSVCLSV